MKPQRYHLEIQRRKDRVYGLIRSSFRREGKVSHKTVGFLSGLTLDQLLMMQAALQGQTVAVGHPLAVKSTKSKEYGASFALLALARELGIDRLLYSRVSESWVQDLLAMIVGRVIYAGSKLALANRWKDTALWELCGTEGPVDVRVHGYAPMDRLLARQGAIEQALIEKHLAGEESLVLYDITSSYLEGQYQGSRLVLFGYNRDRKQGHAQIVFGLVCNAQGCPVAVEVFPGNTQDATTVPAKIEQLRQRYGVKEVILVGDRGMVTASNFASLKGVDGLRLISALTHGEIRELLERRVAQMELFDERRIAEVTDPKEPTIRYCLCRNPETARRETRMRAALMKRTAQALDRIARRKKRAPPQRLGEQVGKILGRTKMGKLLHWEVVDGRLQWRWEPARVDGEQTLDGCYVIRTTVRAERMDRQEVVNTYKQLALVERAFRNMKTVQLEVRPVHHKLDDRIRAHVLLCTLAYYLQWHFQKRLEPLFAKNGQEKDRFWTLENIIERLKSIRREVIEINGVPCRIVSTPEPDQAEILKLLKIKM